ncbi:MAG: TetR/AcrR family transcriptional regulator [bacterium]|nr:TetR/AcrR family transcriptional regulator [bacterium]
MSTERRNRREEIVAATVRLVARQGVPGASIRQIATEAGVTEGALYRHFASKDDLCQQAYQQIVAEMAEEKEQILKSAAPLSAQLREWIRVSFAYFDQYPEAFTYVLLIPYDFTESDISRRQGRMLMTLLAEANRTGQLPDMAPDLALSHFTGLMLNIPRLINEQTLAAPAAQYVDAVATAVCAVLGVRTDTDETPC